MSKELKRRLAAGFALLFVMGCAGSAFADGVGTVAKPKEQTNLMALTFSPFRLLGPSIKLNAEFKAEDQWSIAAVASVGSLSEEVTVLETGEKTTRSFDLWEIGGQVRYYALGGFDNGLHVGTEVIFRDIPIETTGIFSEVTEGTGRGLGVGLFGGYKYATEVGLTLEAQAGLRYDGFGMLAEAESTDDIRTPGEQDLHPMINLNAGWSF